jgi:thymidylate synthase (FAD)
MPSMQLADWERSINLGEAGKTKTKERTIRMSQVEYIGHFGNDLMVANAARVSMGKWKEQLDDADKKLIHYLARNDHTTPFRHPQLQIRVTVPIFVANQLKRHVVGFALNEISRRYVDDDPQFWVPDEWRMRPDKSIKQGSSDIPLHPEVQEMMKEEYKRLLVHAAEFYDDAIKRGIAPELARAALPQSMLTSWVWTGSLHAWLHLHDLRIDPHSQKETQEFAKEVGGLLDKFFPVSFNAWRTKDDNRETKTS